MVVLQIGSALAVIASKASATAEEHDRIATRLLREATGRQDLTVSRRPSGRPCLLAPYPELSVSMSYRDGLLLVGFDPARAVGVDVEMADRERRLDVGLLATDHFAPAEAAAIRALPDAEARDLFLRLWVAKEAALKISGRGIFDGLCEPNLANDIAKLVIDGTAFTVAPSALLPRVEVAICRPAITGLDERPYCALARAASP